MASVLGARARPYRVHDYDVDALAGGVHRGLPSPWLTLVVSLGDPVSVVAPAVPGTPPVRTAHQALLGGLSRSVVLLPQDGPQRGVQLDVHPLAARQLLGLPAGELGGRVLDLDEVLGREGLRLADALTDAGNPRERLAVVEAFVDRRLADPPRHDVAPEVRAAWRLLVGSGGLARVDAVAADVGWGRRHLAARLRAETGLASKDLARVTRFARSAAMLRRAGGRVRLVDAAVACGYADQSHLTHEWRELAGCSPQRWITDELGVLGPIPPRLDEVPGRTIDA
jgi:AraC-like DNA-binding protein